MFWPTTYLTWWFDLWKLHLLEIFSTELSETDSKFIVLGKKKVSSHHFKGQLQVNVHKASLSWLCKSENLTQI